MRGSIGPDSRLAFSVRMKCPPCEELNHGHQSGGARRKEAHQDTSLLHAPGLSRTRRGVLSGGCAEINLAKTWAKESMCHRCRIPNRQDPLRQLTMAWRSEKYRYKFHSVVVSKSSS